LQIARHCAEHISQKILLDVRNTVAGPHTEHAWSLSYISTIESLLHTFPCADWKACSPYRTQRWSCR
jgi:hypothetical protein